MATPPFCLPKCLFRATRCLLGAFFLLVTSSWAAIDTVPPPPTGIFDDTRALSDATHSDLSAAIRSLRTDLKADIWLTTTSFTASGVHIRQQAQATRRRWSGDSPALLMAYDRASNAIALSFSPGLWERYPAASLVELMRDAGRAIADQKLTLEERLTVIVHDVAERLRQLETVRIQHTRWFQQDEKRFALMLAALLIGAALLASVLGLASRSRETVSGQQYFFPDVTVGARLGAPFGGGLIAEVQAPPPSK